MKTKLLIATMVFTPSLAFAGGEDGSLGVGAEADIAGRVSGLSMTYNMESFHVGGLLGFSDAPDPAGLGADVSSFTIGGRGYYHVASTSASDFSVGGGLYLQHTKYDLPGDDDSTDALILDLGFQIRAFITPEVALSFTGGLNVGAADADGVVLAGSLNGGAGVHYYF